MKILHNLPIRVKDFDDKYPIITGLIAGLLVGMMGTALIRLVFPK